MANNTQNFLPADDNWIMTKLPFKASTAIVEGASIAPEVSVGTTTGNFTLSGPENAGGANIKCIMAEPIAATDPDYATAGKRKGVWIPLNATAKSFFRVGAGTFTVADVGKTVEVHTDSASLAVDTAGLGAVITDYISPTRGKCQFRLPYTETA